MGCYGASNRVGSARINGRYIPAEVDFFDGPIRERKCRDILFLILFAVTMTCVGYHVGKAIQIGNPDRYLYGHDDYGNICGKINKPIPGVLESGADMRDRPFLKTCNWMEHLCYAESKCVEKCPEGYFASTFGLCKPYYLHHEIKTMITITENFIQEAIADITTCRSEVVALCIISLSLAFLMLMVLRFCADVIIWITLTVVGIGGLLGTAFLWLLWYDRKKLAENAFGKEKQELDDAVFQYGTAATIVTIGTIVYLLIVISMRNRVRLVAALFKEAGKAINSMPFLLIQPVWTFVSVCFVIYLWFNGLLYLQTAAEPLIVNEKVTYPPTSPFFRGMKFYYSLTCFWLMQFMICCQHLIIAGALATWYFTRDKTKLRSPIFSSLGNLVLYHMGSVALGSALITIVKIWRTILLKAENSLRDNPAGFFSKCCICCLWCLQKFLIYLNRNALIEIAIHGHSFCKAAQQAFLILTSNALRMTAINSIGEFVLFMAKTAVTVATLFIGVKLLQGKEGLHCPLVPVGVACIFAFMTAHCFMSVYEMAIDTLFMCFCEDCARNDGINRPYFMSKSLMMLVERKKKPMDFRPYTKGG